MMVGGVTSPASVFDPARSNHRGTVRYRRASIVTREGHESRTIWQLWPGTATRSHTRADIEPHWRAVTFVACEIGTHMPKLVLGLAEGLVRAASQLIPAPAPARQSMIRPIRSPTTVGRYDMSQHPRNTFVHRKRALVREDRPRIGTRRNYRCLIIVCDPSIKSELCTELQRRDSMLARDIWLPRLHRCGDRFIRGLIIHEAMASLDLPLRKSALLDGIDGYTQNVLVVMRRDAGPSLRRFETDTCICSAGEET